MNWLRSYMPQKKPKFWYSELSNISSKAKIGSGTIIHSHCWIGDNVIIGKRCKIQAFAFLPEGVILEDDVFIGPHACFTNDKRPPSGGKQWAKTIVKKNASIGANATILPGLVIGENALVGAGSVLTKNVPTGEVWAGNPAKKL